MINVYRRRQKAREQAEGIETTAKRLPLQQWRAYLYLHPEFCVKIARACGDARRAGRVWHWDLHGLHMMTRGEE